MSTQTRRSPVEVPASPSDVFEFECGCRVLRFDGRRPEWERIACVKHNRSGLEVTHARFRILLAAQAEYRLKTSEAKVPRFNTHNHPRTFADMSAGGGGFDL